VCGLLVRRTHLVVALLICVAAVAGCRPAVRTRRSNGRPAADARTARGSVLYAGYCGGCHGPDGRGGGPVAAALNLAPTDLRTPGLLAGASDAEVAARVSHGEPLRTAPRGSAFATDLQLAALEDYVLALDGRRWERLRAGRLTYESTCGPCHGVYGTGQGVIGSMLGRLPADLTTARARYTDDSLAAVVRRGVGAMPPMGDMLSPEEVRQVIEYVRLLSPGHRLYDTYCASCHDDDGRGVHPEDALPPAIAAPPLDPRRLARMPAATRRAAVLHMFERERGLMPHFRDILDDEQLAAIIGYLRASQP
jgi:mono/diheme cytochrome c family protein